MLPAYLPACLQLAASPTPMYQFEGHPNTKVQARTGMMLEAFTPHLMDGEQQLTSCLRVTVCTDHLHLMSYANINHDTLHFLSSSHDPICP